MEVGISPGTSEAERDESDLSRNLLITHVKFVKAAHAFCYLTATLKGSFEIEYGAELNVLGLKDNPVEDYQVGLPFSLTIRVDREKSKIFGIVECAENDKERLRKGRPVQFVIVTQDVFDIRRLPGVTIGENLQDRLGRSAVTVEEPHSLHERARNYQQEIVLSVEGGVTKNFESRKRSRREHILELYSEEQKKTIQVEYESDDDIGCLLNKINYKRRKTRGLKKIYNLTQITLRIGDEKLQADQLVKDVLEDHGHAKITQSIDRPRVPSPSTLLCPLNSPAQHRLCEKQLRLGSPKTKEALPARLSPSQALVQKINIAEDATIQQLKEVVIEKLNEGEFDVATFGMPNSDNLRLIRQGIELQPNQAAISQFSIVNNDVLNSQWPRPPPTVQEGRVINNQRNEEEGYAPEMGRGEEATKIRNMSIFQRNFIECVKASKRGINPNDRPRYNDPSREPPPNPVVRDLGNPLDELGNALLQWSSQLHRTADVLYADPRYGNDVDRLDKDRRLIDNNMQAARYLSPIIKHLTNVIIPIDRGENPRRFKVQRQTDQQ
ncbi:Oidioi.mRNA.OKI2018_I69.XSR.g13427.t1.cds [Oikopleura dioica]|uniref:Oidioi.mRNA.OKI2018_I69.XSR.g13427.t1.cds n=1 Tax=Oikopleura dioica TaxID=34765 RepID=A0ABN7SBI4_OIKDI|nr:Oidioi.mRNA.OKI2018_I69.XSR.g13427.t1.cds [Oikopleura dioica]